MQPKTASIPIGVMPGTKLLQLRYEPDTRTFVLWLFHDMQMKHGTFLRLHASGLVERITVRPDGTEEINTVMEAKT